MSHAHHGGSDRRAALGLLTISDTRDATTDRSGAAIRALVEQAGHRVADYRIVPDEPTQIEQALEAWLAADECEVLILNGGTGVSKRDRTFEVVSRRLDKRLDGFGELFRMLSFEQVGSAAMLSRALAGIARGKPIFALPGSTRAVELALNRLILPELGHLLDELER